MSVKQELRSPESHLAIVSLKKNIMGNVGNLRNDFRLGLINFYKVFVLQEEKSSFLF